MNACQNRTNNCPIMRLNNDHEMLLVLVISMRDLSGAVATTSGAVIY